MNTVNPCPSTFTSFPNFSGLPVGCKFDIAVPTELSDRLTNRHFGSIDGVIRVLLSSI